MTPTFKITPNAADKIAELLAEEKDNPNLHFRAYVQGGGCSGFEYGFTFDDEVNEDEDFIFEQPCSNGQTIKVLVDSMSYQYLENAEVDYKTGLQGEQFVIKNPNAKTTCGCGSSFSVGED